MTLSNKYDVKIEGYKNSGPVVMVRSATDNALSKLFVHRTPNEGETLTITIKPAVVNSYRVVVDSLPGKYSKSIYSTLNGLEFSEVHFDHSKDDGIFEWVGVKGDLEQGKQVGTRYTLTFQGDGQRLSAKRALVAAGYRNVTVTKE